MLSLVQVESISAVGRVNLNREYFVDSEWSRTTETTNSTLNITNAGLVGSSMISVWKFSWNDKIVFRKWYGGSWKNTVLDYMRLDLLKTSINWLYLRSGIQYIFVNWRILPDERFVKKSELTELVPDCCIYHRPQIMEHGMGQTRAPPRKSKNTYTNNSRAWSNCIWRCLISDSLDTQHANLLQILQIMSSMSWFNWTNSRYFGAVS